MVSEVILGCLFLSCGRLTGASIYAKGRSLFSDRTYCQFGFITLVPNLAWKPERRVTATVLTCSILYLWVASTEHTDTELQNCRPFKNGILGLLGAFLHCIHHLFVWGI